MQGHVLLVAAALAIGCSQSDETRGGNDDAAAAVARGERIYRNVCATCHGGDPSEDGVLGPAIVGSSRELVEARVVNGEYPEGYTPKRASAQMPAFPHLADHVDDLTAFLRDGPER